jgi:hypothetical protein
LECSNALRVTAHSLLAGCRRPLLALITLLAIAAPRPDDASSID